jgi:hypothetical protein
VTIIPGSDLANQLDAEHASDRTRSEARYVLLKLRLAYAKNRTLAIPPTTGGTLTALKEITHTGDGGGVFSAVVKEDTVIPGGTAAELRFMAAVGLPVADGTDAKLVVPPSGPVLLNASQLPDAPDDQVDAGHVWVRLKQRVGGSDPSTGVQIVTKTGQGADAHLEAKVNELTVQAVTAGGQIGYQPAVEWPVMSSLNATAQIANVGLQRAHTLVDPVRTFTGLVTVGDFVQLVANGNTTDPSVAGKFFRVEAVGTGTLQLSLAPYTRMPDGTYAAQALEAANYSSPYDFKVVRVQTEAVFLRHASQTFAGIKAGDYLHARWTDTLTAQTFDKVFVVSAVPAPGLLLLDVVVYAAGKAPYGGAMTVTPGDYFLESAVYSLTRAPGNLSYFRLTSVGALFTQRVKVGDYVRFIARTGILDATAGPGPIVGSPSYYRVATVASDDVVTFAPTKYKQVLRDPADPASGEFQPEGASFYQDVDTFVDFEVYAVAASYPHATVWKVTGIARQAGTVTSYALARALYDGYGGINGAFTVHAGVVPVITDHYDVELIQTFPDQLVLYHPTGDLSRLHAFTSTQADYIKTTARTSAPVTQAPATTVGIYAVAAVPRKDVAFLTPVRLAGSKPKYQVDAPFPATPFADACDYTAVRVSGEYRAVSFTLTSGTAEVGDFMKLDQGPPEARGYWKVTAVAGQTLTLDPKNRYDRLVTEVFEAVPLDAQDVTTLDLQAAVGFYRKSDRTSTLTLERAGTSFNGLPTLLDVPGPNSVIDHGAVVTVYTGPANARVTQHFLVTIATATKLFLSPVPLTVDANGTYKMGSAALSVAQVLPADFVVYQATSLFTDASDKLTYLRDHVIGTARLASLDATFGLLTQSKDPADMQAVADAAVRQAAKLVAGNYQFPVPAEPPINAVTLTPDAIASGLNDASFTQARDAGYDVLVSYPNYQIAVAFATAVDFQGYFDTKTLSEMKDAFVEAELLSRGYADWLAFIGAGAGVGVAARSQLRQRAVAGQAIARKYVDGVAAAMGARDRAAIETSIRSQLDNLVNLVKTQVLPDGYANPYRFFVQPGTVQLKADFVAQLLALPFVPGFTLGQLRQAETDPEPKVRRDALKGMVGVPADRSLRAKRRSFALSRNRQNYLTRMGEDLQRHIDTATQPDVKARMMDFMGELNGWVDQAKTTAEETVADVADDLQTTFTELENAVDPNDGQTVAEQAEALETFESEGLLPLTEVAPSEAAAVTAKVTTLSTANATPARPAAAERLVITNLFTNDFNDFRKTGIAVGLDVFDADVTDPSNRSRLASLYLTDLEDNIVLGLNLKGSKAGTFSGERYNQFILTTVQESYADKFQVQDTLGEGWLASAFGERPEIWSFSGVLINDAYSDQVSKFRELWTNFIRITKLAKGKRKMAMDVPAAGVLVVGFPINLTLTTDANQNEKVVPFSMQVLVSRVYRKPLINLVDVAEQAIPAAISNIPAGGNLQRATESGQADKDLAATKLQQESLVHKLQMDAKNAVAPAAKAAAAARLADPTEALRRTTQTILQRKLPFPL